MSDSGWPADILSSQLAQFAFDLDAGRELDGGYSVAAVGEAAVL
jgi:hypothetical protein